MIEPIPEAASTRSPRRRRTSAEKRKIVEETLKPGTPVSIVARRHDVNANQLFSWRRQYRKGELTEGKPGTPALIPVGIIGDPACLPSRVPKMIEISLATGVNVRIDGEVGQPALNSILAMIRGLL